MQYSARLDETPTRLRLTVARFDIAMDDLVVRPSPVISLISWSIIHGQAGFDQVAEDVP